MIRETRGRVGAAWGMLAAAALSIPGAAPAQVRVESRALTLEVGGRVHTQLNTTSASGPGVPGSEFLVRRARLTIDATVDGWIDGRVQPDFGEGELSLKDAYVRLAFGPGLEVRFGQFKRPFDLFELTSSTRILVIERAGGVRGVDACPGPGGICSLSRFTEKLEYADRDIGAEVSGVLPGGRLRYAAAVTNGTGAGAAEENGPKSFSGRLEYALAPGLVVAGNVSAHDYVDPRDDTDARGTAWGGDVEWGDFGGGLHVQAGVVGGENWRNIVPDADGLPRPSTFLAAQVIAAYRIPSDGGGRVSAVEPVARVSWGDPDDDAGDDAGLLLTPGLVVHFTGRNKIAANVDYSSPESGDSEWSLKVQSYLHF